jgi:tetratricopeptide (TPR) repeat protein
MMLATFTLATALLAPATAVAAQDPAATRMARPAGDAESHIDAGRAAYRRRNFQEAQRHFQAAVDADPMSAAANFYLGYTVYKIAEPKHPFHPEKRRAAELFAKAYELDPRFVPRW